MSEARNTAHFWPYSSVFLSLLLGLSWPTQLLAQITVDGQIDEAEWANAIVMDNFVELQPLTSTPVPEPLHTEARLLATPEGLAVAIIARQPAQVPRVVSRVQRDFSDQVDRANFMVDFDANGRAGYAFTISAGNDIADEVITNESRFNSDWDGDWQHAVQAQAEGYSYEFLIPWSITSMQAGENSKRTIAVYFDRVVANTGQRFGTPAASFSQPRFLSDFTKVEIADYQQSLLAITPYVVGLADLKGQDQQFKAGADVFWKPNNNHQFAFTLNPDFGQVESDELVVNFDNFETFFTDKRPFFTDNQAAFESGMPGGNLLYTRRIGAPADDGSGASDIDAAVKGSGNFGDFGYAVFGASEDGDAGRDFLFLRGAHRSDTHDVDFTQIEVDRPFLDRRGKVSAVHGVFRPNSEWRLDTAIHQSRVQIAGRESRGIGGGITADWDMPGPFRQQYFAVQVDRDSDLNDLGFQDRNNFRYFEWETGYREDALDESSRFASHAWEFELTQQENLDGFMLRRNITLQRYSELRDSSTLFFFIRRVLPAFEDRISRGNGVARIRGGYSFYAEGSRARQDGGRLSWTWLANSYPGRSRPKQNYLVGLEPRIYFSDTLDLSVGLNYTRWNDWLLWRGGSTLASFTANRLDLSSSLNWFISDKQELRVKLQAIGIDADFAQAYQIAADQRLQSSGQANSAPASSGPAIADFRLRNLGFQMRYRYKLGNLSDLFAVYSRGGASFDDEQDNAFDVLGSAFELRDDDQFLIKLAYRFDI